MITSPDPSTGFDFHIESPDQIIAKRTVVGPTTSGDRDVVENDRPEIDPLFSASAAATITNLEISNRNTAYSRGDHHAAGYLTGEEDPQWNLDKPSYYTKGEIDAAGYLTSYSEGDPLFSASAAATITSGNVSHWNTAYSRGDHHAAGYLTSVALN